MVPYKQSEILNDHATLGPYLQLWSFEVRAESSSSVQHTFFASMTLRDTLYSKEKGMFTGIFNISDSIVWLVDDVILSDHRQYTRSRLLASTEGSITYCTTAWYIRCYAIRSTYISHIDSSCALSATRLNIWCGRLTNRLSSPNGAACLYMCSDLSLQYVSIHTFKFHYRCLNTLQHLSSFPDSSCSTNYLVRSSAFHWCLIIT